MEPSLAASLVLPMAEHSDSLMAAHWEHLTVEHWEPHLADPKALSTAVLLEHLLVGLSAYRTAGPWEHHLVDHSEHSKVELTDDSTADSKALTRAAHSELRSADY